MHITTASQNCQALFSKIIIKKEVDIPGQRWYYNSINRSKRAGLRQARGREKLLRATGWPNSDLNSAQNNPMISMTYKRFLSNTGPLLTS